VFNSSHSKHRAGCRPVLNRQVGGEAREQWAAQVAAMGKQ
jgi:hypothetical protein